MVRTGAYEPASLNLALSLMYEQPGLFVDVGANFGLFTCAIATIPNAAVVSLEPDAANCAELRQNVRMNRFQNVVIEQIAASAQSSRVQLIQRTKGNSGTVAVRLASDPSSDTQWIKAEPLKEILKEAASSTSPTLIKIDVEGFERAVLDGIDFAGPQRPQNIIFEYTPQLTSRSWASFDEVREYFSARSYILSDVRGQEITDANDILEDNIWARAL
jgi:FkbM family methyltransferase